MHASMDTHLLFDTHAREHGHMAIHNLTHIHHLTDTDGWHVRDNTLVLAYKRPGCVIVVYERPYAFDLPHKAHKEFTADAPF